MIDLTMSKTLLHTADLWNYRVQQDCIHSLGHKYKMLEGKSYKNNATKHLSDESKSH